MGSQGVDKIPRSLKNGLTVQKFLRLKVVRAGIEPGKPAPQARALTTRLSALSKREHLLSDTVTADECPKLECACSL